MPSAAISYREMSSSNALLRGKKVVVIGGSSGRRIYLFLHPSLVIIYLITTGIGFSVAAAALSNDALVVVASSSQARVDAAVEKLKKEIEGKDNAVVSGQAFDVKDYAALTGFLTKEAPFDHLVSVSVVPMMFN